jgi:molybdate transport repressor ModE-like protein
MRRLPGGSPSKTVGKSSPAADLTALRRHLTPRHKVWLNWDGLFLMGPNYLRFLAAVDQTGTIREGGQAVGWSYRTCLNRLRRMERVLGRPVLLTRRGGTQGGSARLTGEARRLVRIFAQWEEDVARLSRRAFERAALKSSER